MATSMMSLARQAFNDDIFRYASVVESEYDALFKPKTIKLLKELEEKGWTIELRVWPRCERNACTYVVGGRLQIYVMFVAWDGCHVWVERENQNPNIAIQEAYDHVMLQGKTPEELRFGVNKHYNETYLGTCV